jgi:hypothetical protein
MQVNISAGEHVSTLMGYFMDFVKWEQQVQIRLVLAKLASPSSVRERIQKSLFREKAKTKTCCAWGCALVLRLHALAQLVITFERNSRW